MPEKQPLSPRMRIVFWLIWGTVTAFVAPPIWESLVKHLADVKTAEERGFTEGRLHQIELQQRGELQHASGGK